MHENILLLGCWMIRFCLASGILLLGGWLIVRSVASPKRQWRIGTGTVLLAIAILPVTLLPGWLALPWEIASLQEQVGSPVSFGQQVSNERAKDWEAPGNNVVRFSEPEAFVLAEALPHEPDHTVLASSVASLPVQCIGGIETSASRGSVPPWIWLVAGLSIGYLVCVLAMMLRLASGMRSLSRLWASGKPVPRFVIAMLREVGSPRLSLPEVRVSGSISSPICFGVWRPRIMLPESYVHQRDDATLRWVLAHELDHLDRSDPLLNWLLGLGQALFFFWPWYTKLRHQIRLSQEYLADAAAIAKGTRQYSPNQDGSLAADYAEFLLRMAGQPRTPLGATGVRGTTSDLFWRISMLLKNTSPVERRTYQRLSWLFGGGLLILGMALAGFYLPARAIDAAPQVDTKKDAPKPATDDEDEIRKAIDELKKGPPAKKEEPDTRPAEPVRPGVPGNAIPDFPGIPDINNRFEEIQRRQMEAMKRLMEMHRNGLPGGNDAFDQEIRRMQEEMQKMMEDLTKQMQLFPGGIQLQPLPGIGGGRIFGGNGLNRIDRFARGNEGRLGVRVEKPTPALIEQLDIPAGKGLLITDILSDSAAGKAGMKTNDIILEMDGKPVSSDITEFIKALREIKPDTPIDFVVVRKGKKETIKGVKLPEGMPLRIPGIRPGIQIPNLPLPGVPGVGGANVIGSSISISRTNDDFTVNYVENGLKATVSGKVVNGKAMVTAIDIDDNGIIIKSDAVDKIAERYQEIVKKITAGIR